MGVSISTHTSTSPLTVTSTVIGFVSFGFTLGTFFKVVWANLSTMGEAPHEVHTYLTGIRTELLEERANLRALKKGIKKFKKSSRRTDTPVGIELDEMAWKTMNDQLRHYIKQFRELERPFLAQGEHGIGDARTHSRSRRRAGSSTSPPRYSHGAYSSPPEKYDRDHVRTRGRHDRDAHPNDDSDEEIFWAQRTHYASFTLRHRLQWLTRKSEAQQLVSELTRLQLRRVARQVTGMVVMVHEYGHETYEMYDTIRRIDDRVSRVVGVRRISE